MPQVLEQITAVEVTHTWSDYDARSAGVSRSEVPRGTYFAAVPAALLTKETSSVRAFLVKTTDPFLELNFCDGTIKRIALYTGDTAREAIHEGCEAMYDKTLAEWDYDGTDITWEGV